MEKGGGVIAAELVRAGDYWTIVFDGREMHMRHSKGMALLADLLARPGVEVAALDLVAGGADARTTTTEAARTGLSPGLGSDTGPVLDAEAKSAYRRRLEDLRAELDEAEAFHDPERAERARREYEFVARELASAAGFGRRDRRTGSPEERARLNVTRAIKTAIERCHEHDAALGGHLDATVSTGRYCVYRPDRSPPVQWRIVARSPLANLPRRFEPPEVSYVAVEGVSIAYEVLGDGPVDFIFVPSWLSHLDLQWTEPNLTRLLRNLARFSRVVMFDKRGVGLSDPVARMPTIDERVDDVAAVMDAARAKQAVLFGLYEGAATACLFAATHPERVKALVLWGPLAVAPAVASFPGDAELAEAEARLRIAAETSWGRGGTLELIAPDLAKNRLMRRLWGAFERASMSPAVARAQIEWMHQLDIRVALPAIQAPTLVLGCTGDVVPIATGRYVAEQIPGARFLAFDGNWHIPLTGDMDQLVDAIEEFVEHMADEPEPELVLATVVVIESDHERLHALVHGAVIATGGRVVDAKEQQVAARFAGPARAIRCAQVVADQVGAAGGVVRAGIHTGECQVTSDGLSGPVGGVAAALALRAAPGEIVVTSVVRQLTSGSSTKFTALGTCRFAGAGEWSTYTVGDTLPAARLPTERAEPVSLIDRAARTLARRAPGAARSAMRVVKGST